MSFLVGLSTPCFTVIIAYADMPLLKNLVIKIKKELFPYSTNQFIFIVFITYYMQEFLGSLLTLGRLSGLPYRYIDNPLWNIGQLIMYFCVWYSFPLLSTLYIISKHIHFVNPFKEISDFIRYFLMLFCIVFIVYLSSNILFNGFYSYFKFMGYSVYNLFICIRYISEVIDSDNFLVLLIQR